MPKLNITHNASQKLLAIFCISFGFNSQAYAAINYHCTAEDGEVTHFQADKSRSRLYQIDNSNPDAGYIDVCEVAKRTFGSSLSSCQSSVNADESARFQVVAMNGGNSLNLTASLDRTTRRFSVTSPDFQKTPETCTLLPSDDLVDQYQIYLNSVQPLGAEVVVANNTNYGLLCHVAVKGKSNDHGAWRRVDISTDISVSSKGENSQSWSGLQASLLTAEMQCEISN